MSKINKLIYEGKEYLPGDSSKINKKPKRRFQMTFNRDKLSFPCIFSLTLCRSYAWISGEFVIIAFQIERLFFKISLVKTEK